MRFGSGATLRFEIAGADGLATFKNNLQIDGDTETDGKIAIGGNVDGTHYEQLRIHSPNTTLAVNQDYYALNVNPGGTITTPSSGENTNIGS